MFDGRWREGVDRRTKSSAALIRRTGVTPNHLTALGLVLAAGAGVLVGAGHLVVGVFVGVAAAFNDLLDGAVAKAGGTASTRGAFFDSVADRVSDAFMFGGVAWYLASTGNPHGAMLAVAILGASAVVSYERAKAESLGLVAKGGLMERAERLIAMGIGLLIRPLLIPVLWAVLVLTILTGLNRFYRVWQQASPDGTRAVREAQQDPEAQQAQQAQQAQGVTRAAEPIAAAERSAAAVPRHRLPWGPGRVDSRWRSWRERAVLRSAHAGRERGHVSRWRARRQSVPSSRASRAGRSRSQRPGGRTGSTSWASWGLRSQRSGNGRRRLSEALRRRVDGGPS